MNTAATVRRTVTASFLPHAWTLRALGALAGAIAMGFVASIKIPVPWTPVPITLQTLALFIGAATLGRHFATQMILWYLGLGVIGLPFFAGGASGWAVFMGPTGGYLVGFLLAATIIGYGQPRVRGFWTQSLLFAMASALLFTCGFSWLAFSLKLTLHQALWAGVIPFLPGDLLKILIASFVLRSQARFSKNSLHSY